MNRRKRLSKLKKLAAPVIDRMKKADEAYHRNLQRRAKVHAVNFAAIALYGEPKLEEPLSEAWPRCKRASIWQGFSNRALLPLLNPFDDLGAETLAGYLYEKWVPTLPGTDDKKKFDPIFANAPPWLIWFTFADWTAKCLELELPDLAQISNFDRPIEVLQRDWPGLPKGKFEIRSRRDGLAEISEEDLDFYLERRDFPEEEMTRLERKRFLCVTKKMLAAKKRAERQ